MQKYREISLGKGHESEPFLYQEAESGNITHFHKEYKNKDYDNQALEKDDIIFDHALHHLLSEEEGVVHTHKFVLGGKSYKGIKIRVLDKNPNEIYMATRLSTKEQIYCTHPTYIAGKTLNEFEDTFYDHNIGMKLSTAVDIHGKIETYIKGFVADRTTNVLGYPLYIGQLNPLNIKVVDTNNSEYLQIIITDLFAQYNWFVRQNKDVIQQAKSDLRKIFNA